MVALEAGGTFAALTKSVSQDDAPVMLMSERWEKSLEGEGPHEDSCPLSPPQQPGSFRASQAGVEPAVS